MATPELRHMLRDDDLNHEVDAIKGGAIPGGLVPAVDKGVQEAMAEGIIAGYPMVDVKCTVFDGSYHPVDSNEMAFKTAARIGFRAACEQATPVVLEPMATMSIAVSESFAGAVMGDISTRRGRIIGTDSNDAGETVIMVRVPYAEVVSYTKDLRSISRGSGSYTIELDGYEQAPADVQKKARRRIRSQASCRQLTIREWNLLNARSV